MQTEVRNSRWQFKLVKWSEDWQMLFNLDKCAEGMGVRLDSKVLGAQKSERDLGFIMQSDLKVDNQGG